VKYESSSNRSLDVIREADVGQRKESHEPQTASMANLGGTAECLSAFRPIVDGRFFVCKYVIARAMFVRPKQSRIGCLRLLRCYAPRNDT
jgi:hypothetical protein